MKKTINLYFGGTKEPHPEDDKKVSTAFFYEHDQAEAQAINDWKANNTSVKCAFSGPLDLLDSIFGWGVEVKAQQVAEQIQALLVQDPQLHITLNAYGFSRGGITALLMAKKLAQIDPKRLNIHLALSDPVPGNLRGTQQWLGRGLWGKTLTQKTSNVSECQSLKKVLYLHSQHKGTEKGGFLKNIVRRLIKPFFAPIVPIWPKDCSIEEDVIPGYHGDAVEGLGAQDRCLAFLKTCGVKFDKPPSIPKNTETGYDTALQTLKRSTKKTIHSCPYTPKRVIAEKSGNYLNKHHKALVLQKPIEEVSDESCCLKVVQVGLKAHALKTAADKAIPTLQTLLTKIQEMLTKNLGSEMQQTLVWPEIKNGSKPTTPASLKIFLHKLFRANKPKVRADIEEAVASVLQQQDFQPLKAWVTHNAPIKHLHHAVYAFSMQEASFKSLCRAIKGSLSKQSLTSQKGQLLNSYLTNKLTLDSPDAFNIALQTVIALALQRDRFSLSFFTQSSIQVVHLLNNKETYAYFKAHILATLQLEPSTALTHRHLQDFVLNEPHPLYFHYKNKDHAYRCIEHSQERLSSRV